MGGLSGLCLRYRVHLTSYALTLIVTPVAAALSRRKLLTTRRDVQVRRRWGLLSCQEEMCTEARMP
jgi:hypothetical protein